MLTTAGGCNESKQKDTVNSKIISKSTQARHALGRNGSTNEQNMVVCILLTEEINTGESTNTSLRVQWHPRHMNGTAQSSLFF